MTTILTKKKDTSGAPAPGDLTNAAGGAELAVNTADKRLYTKNSGGNVVEIGTNPTILNIDNIQIDGSTISSTNTNGDINITPNGTGSVVVSKLNVTGAMTFDGNVTVGNSSADTLVVNSTITSNLIFTDNTYDIGASGATRPRSLFLGTNLTVGSLTSTRVPYASTGGLLIDSANMTFNGTRLTVADLADSGLTATRVVYSTTGGALVDSANLTFDGTNLTLGGGTANGVAYLNGSKVLTTGSALTFDGINLGVGATTAAARVDIVGGADNQFRLSSSETNATTKEAKFLIRHYTNAQPNFLVMYPYSTSTDNAVFYGGGSSAQTAATFHAWVTAANNTTVSGSEQMRLTSTGLGIGTSSPTFRLDALSSGSTQVARFRTGGLSTSDVVSFERSDSAVKAVINYNGTDGCMSYGTTTNHPIGFWTNNTERMRITSAGNVCIGSTEPGNAGVLNLSVGNPGTTVGGLQLWSTTSGTHYVQFGDSASGGAPYSGAVGYNHSVDALTFWTNQTEKMRITTGGAVGIGTNSPQTALQVNAAAPTIRIEETTTGGSKRLELGVTSAGVAFISAPQSAQELTFQTVGTERARITSGGDYVVGSSSTVGSAGRIQAVQASSTGNACISADAQSSSYAYNIAYLNTNTAAGSGFYFISCTTSNYGTYQFRVRGDGVIYAQNTTVQSLSDVRVKENIRDSEEGLPIILGLKPRRFDFKQGFGNDRKNVLGFIAQEIETVFPDAVDVTPVDPDGDGPEEPYKSVGPGSLIPVLVKAIQELKAEFDAYKATHP